MQDSKINEKTIDEKQSEHSTATINQLTLQFISKQSPSQINITDNQTVNDELDLDQISALLYSAKI
jgi:hypothetical protein